MRFFEFWLLGCLGLRDIFREVSTLAFFCVFDGLLLQLLAGSLLSCHLLATGASRHRDNSQQSACQKKSACTVWNRALILAHDEVRQGFPWLRDPADARMHSGSQSKFACSCNNHNNKDHNIEIIDKNNDNTITSTNNNNNTNKKKNNNVEASFGHLMCQVLVHRSLWFLGTGQWIIHKSGSSSCIRDF